MTSLETYIELIGQALRLEPEAFRAAETLPGLALSIVLLAGVSVALGQAVVLFVNRVKPERFIASLLVSAIHYAFGFGFWTLSIWLLGRFLHGDDIFLGNVARAVGLGYAPQLFSFLIFMPYFGIPIYVLLTLWSLLAIVTGVSVSMNLLTWHALLLSGLGWFVLQVSKRTIGRPLIGLARWSRRRVAGVELRDLRELERQVKSQKLELPTPASTELTQTSNGENRAK